MSYDYSKHLLRTGIAEAKGGNREAARRYLDRAIYMSGADPLLSEAWFWMSEVLDDPVEKRKALENCLAHDMRHARGRRALAVLEGKLKADELIDPDHLPPTPDELRAADVQRFMCPKCGGRMSFSPDGSSLVCDYCTRDQKLGDGDMQTGEKDFIIAMATARGHGRPLQEQVFHCNGCGAEFILPPQQISASCVYCDSPHVVSLEKTRDLLAPDAIIPYAFDHRHATQLLIEWVEGRGIKPEKKVDRPRGLYLPLWTFDLGGAIDYTGMPFAHISESERLKFPVPIVEIQEQFPVSVDDLPLPASRKLSSVFLRLIPSFEMNALKPYDPRFLSGWPAEMYDISMAEASLDARSQVYERYKREIPVFVNELKITHTSSANLVIESFKLNLLPVWMTEIPFDGREHLLLINGQNGVVADDLADREQEGPEKHGLLDFLSDLLND
jgi:hypothetical protein